MKPSSLERHLSVESLESRRMMSGTTLAPLQAEQQLTEASIDAVLRAEPVKLFSGEKEFTGSNVECIADSPIFTDGSFTLEMDVRPNVQQFQTFVSKYNSSDNADQSIYLGMDAKGRIQFSVYGENGDYRLLYTDGAPLTIGVWQNVRASFDIQSQKMSVMVNGKEVPSTVNAISKEIPHIHDGRSPIRLGASVFGSGVITNHLKGWERDVTFWPVASFGIPEQTAAVDAAVTEEEAVLPLTEAEANAVIGKQQITATAIDAILRAEPVKLLEGIKEFNGSQVECIADSPVFTDGSFTIEASVRPNAIRAQVLVSKYNSQSEPGQSFILTMLADGRLRFCVYGNPAANEMQMTETNGALKAGVWQKVQASFDITSQKMSLVVDGVAVPATQVEGLPPVTAIYDSTSPVRVGDTIFGSGRSWIYEGGMENITYYPVQSFDAQEEAAATDAIITEEEAVLPLTEAEANALTTTADTTATTPTEVQGTEKELTAEMVQTVLTDLLQKQEAAPPQVLTDTPDLSGATLQNGVLQIALPTLGGTASMMSWQGHAKGHEVKAITGQEGRLAAIAAGVIVEEQTIDTTPALVDVLDLPEGIQTDANGIHHTVHVQTAELGKVCVCVDDGRKSINLVNRNGNIGGEGSGYLLGQAGLSLEFEDGPRYVQWIDLKRLSGSTSVKVYVWDAQGVVRTLWASESGRLQIDGTVRIMATYPEQQSSSWVIQAINTDPIVPPPAFEETWMQSSGELVGIDLSDTEQAVQSVDLTVRSNNPANTIQAIAYRGEERLEAQTIAEDGTVHFASDTGITSILLTQSDPSATLYVTSLSAGGTEGMAAPAATDLTPISNADVAKAGARQWEHGTFNPGDIAVKNGVLMNRGGYENRVNGCMLFQSGNPVNSQTQYTRYTLTATSGSVGITGLWYADFDGLHRVPNEYWQVVAGNSVIIAPGGPQYIVIEVGGNGTFDVGAQVADHATDIMPSQEMALRSSVLVVRGAGPAEGFCTVPPTVSSQNQHARAGGTVNMFYQIINDGIGGGAITVRIHVGQTGTTSDMVTREFVGNMNGLSTIGLSVDVTLGSDNDFATMEVVGADGQSTIVGKQVQPPKLARTFADEMSAGDQALAYATRRGQTLQGKIAYAIAHSSKLQTLAYNYQNAVVPVVASTSSPAPTEQPTGTPEEIVGEMAKEIAVVAMAGELETTDTGTETVNAAQQNMENLIKERVAARLNERLQSMTMEERATARGLLRLQEDGKLEEYFSSLFNGESSTAVEAALNNTGNCSVYYLLDTDVLVGAGHAAMIMGSDSEGWYYFSFGYGSPVPGVGTFFTTNGNMEVGYFASIQEAQKALDRYDGFLRWNTINSSAIRSAFREASSYLTSDYNLVSQNCDDIASDIIRSAGIQLDDAWKPTDTYNYYWGEADEIGNWKVFVP